MKIAAPIEIPRLARPLRCGLFADCEGRESLRERRGAGTLLRAFSRPPGLRIMVWLLRRNTAKEPAKLVASPPDFHRAGRVMQGDIVRQGRPLQRIRDDFPASPATPSIGSSPRSFHSPATAIDQSDAPEYAWTSRSDHGTRSDALGTKPSPKHTREENRIRSTRVAPRRDRLARAVASEDCPDTVRQSRRIVGVA
jgi:hypothetical protein